MSIDDLVDLPRKAALQAGLQLRRSTVVTRDVMGTKFIVASLPGNRDCPPTSEIRLNSMLETTPRPSSRYLFLGPGYRLTSTSLSGDPSAC